MFQILFKLLESIKQEVILFNKNVLLDVDFLYIIFNEVFYVLILIKIRLKQ